MPLADASIIFHYFPELNTRQKEQFEQLYALYEDWNEKINLISRKDFQHFYERHVLHSLGIAKVIHFKAGTKILDVGTGGGFPGIPLAILFPDSEFTLIDSIGKKIKVVDAVTLALGLKNVASFHQRAEETKGKFHFVVSRGVTDISEFHHWVKYKFEPTSFNTLVNGIIALKGGELDEEYAAYLHKMRVFNLKDYFKEEFFETKKVVFLPVR
ncbi:MAG: 16S rRNA (guanine(527)-N(7))-methyltransferase RsmG [Bacteroidota bacterium]